MSTQDTDPKPLATADWHDSLSHIKEDMNGAPLNIHKLMANHPQLLKAWWNFRNYSITGGELGSRKGELVILRVAVHMKTWYEWAAHVTRGMASGLSLEEIQRVKQGGTAKGWDEDEALLLNAVDELLEDHRLSESTRKKLSGFFSDRQIMDLITLHGMYIIIACMINTWELELDQEVSDKLPKEINRDNFLSGLDRCTLLLELFPFL